MKGYDDWKEIEDVSGVTVYYKKINGYEREVYYSPKIHKWCFKKWTRTSGSLPEVGSRESFEDCIKECEE